MQVIVGIVLMVIGIVFARYAFYVNSIIREAEKNIRVRRFMGRRLQYSQSVEGLHAGRDITITQIANEATLDAWTHSFWRGRLVRYS